MKNRNFAIQLKQANQSVNPNFDIDTTSNSKTTMTNTSGTALYVSYLGVPITLPGKAPKATGLRSLFAYSSQPVAKVTLGAPEVLAPSMTSKYKPAPSGQ